MSTLSTPKERPIGFNGPNVRAILEGRKTQTRRIVKSKEPVHECKNAWVAGGIWRFSNWEPKEHVGFAVKCPYGKPGDRLWVKETWADVTRAFQLHECEDVQNVAFRADDSVYVAGGAYLEKLGDSGIIVDKWRPSIFLPHYASRLTLEIAAVRVERLQDISNTDLLAEGVPPLPYSNPDDPIDEFHGRYESAFQSLWDSINGKRAPWDSNPWVWVVEFKRVES